MHKFVINIILIVILVIMGISLYKVLNSRVQQDSNVSDLRNLYETQKTANSKLSQQYTYYTSSEYLEKVSRDDLNLVPQGEYLVVLPSPAPLAKNATLNRLDDTIKKPLFEQWFDLLIR